MDIRAFLKNRWFTRGVIVAWLISSVFVLGLLFEIDGIVHGTLYDYGLQFNLKWAEPYWLLRDLVLFCVALPMVLGGLALFSSFLRTEDVETQTSERKRKTEPSKKPQKRAAR